MKFTLQNDSGVNVVLSCTARRIVVRELAVPGIAPVADAPARARTAQTREHVIEKSALLATDAIVFDWPPRDPSTLTVEHIRVALRLTPELILLGTGERQEFPAPGIAKAVQGAGVGFEVMDTRAACRTYNVLSQEGRRVVAALLMRGD